MEPSLFSAQANAGCKRHCAALVLLGPHSLRSQCGPARRSLAALAPLAGNRLFELAPLAVWPSVPPCNWPHSLRSLEIVFLNIHIVSPDAERCNVKEEKRSSLAALAPLVGSRLF